MATQSYSGPDRRAKHESSEQFIVIKSWHLVIIVLTLIVTVTLFVGSLRDGHDEDARRIRDIEMRPQVSQQSIDELNRRLNSLETRLNDQDLREFRMLGEPQSTKKMPR